jgi:hypothetical protein
MLASLFDLDCYQSIGNFCDQVRSALIKDFVPKYLGANHLSRDEWTIHATHFAKELLNVQNNELALIGDGTYIYCQKSLNNSLQKKT